MRELRYAVERATILARAERLVPEDFPFAAETRPPAPPGSDDSDMLKVGADLHLERLEKRAIERALALRGGNISQAAAALGLTRPALYRRMSKHGL